MSPPVTVWLVRHGESEWNRRGLAQGQAEAPGLTDQGREQVRRAAGALRGTGTDLVLSSDLRRAVETADIVATVLGLDVRLDHGLRERRLGRAEGRPSSELVGPGGGGARAGWVVDPDVGPPGGETIRQLVRRVRAYLEELPGRSLGQRLILVTHGGVVRAAAGLAAGRDPDRSTDPMGWQAVPNATALRLVLPLRPGATEAAFDPLGNAITSV